MEAIKKISSLAIIALLGSSIHLNAQVNVFTEDFDGATLGVTSSSASGNNNSAWSLNSNYQTNGANSDSARVALGDTLYLESNAFSTTGFSNMSLSFDQICKIDFFDRAFIEYSTNNGSTWTRLTNADYNGAGFFNSSYFSSVSYPDWNPASATAIPTNNWWKTENFDLSAAAGNNQVKVRWLLIDADNNGAVNNYGWLLDNIVITAAPCELVPPTIAINGTILQGQVYSTGPYQINTTITDASGVASATLSYTINGGAINTVNMTVNNMTTWLATIPSANVGDTVCYSIAATDNTTCGNVANYPSSTGCVQFIVANNPPPTCVGTPVFNFNYLESFGSFTPGNGSSTVGTLQNNWINDNSDSHDWWVFDQATSSGGTGPTQDHSPNDNNYLYVESSGSFSNKIAILNTPCFDLTNLSSPKFDFWHHMQGNQMGSLRLDIFFGGQWVLDVMPPIIGDQGPNWNYRRVDLSQYAGNIVKLRFRAITGSGFLSDIAIDDIEIIEPRQRDIELTNIFSPNARGCTGSANEFVTFQITSNGSQTVDTIPMAYIVNGGSVVRDTLFSQVNEGDTLNFTFQQTVNMSVLGTYNFQFWTDLPGDQNRVNDSLLTFAITTSNVIAVFPDSNDFENFIPGNPGAFRDGWNNSQADDIDWFVNAGSTQSNNTGPSGDHTTGMGNYLYTEATNNFNREAKLLGKCLDISNLNQPELSFWYHMSGFDMGDLHLDININGVEIQDIMPVISGDQGNNWLNRTVDLTPYKGNIKLTFRAMTGPGFTSDIAIDDVVIKDLAPVGIGEDGMEKSSISVYPNPAQDVLTIEMGDSRVNRLQIFNSMGKLIFDSSISNSKKRTLDVSDWSAGVYLMQLEENGKFSQEKLILR